MPLKTNGDPTVLNVESASSQSMAPECTAKMNDCPYVLYIHIHIYIADNMNIEPSKQ